jgi:hypothetical protein
MTCLKALSRHLFGEGEENLVGINVNSAKIRTVFLPSTCLNCDRCASLVGQKRSDTVCYRDCDW